MVISTRCGPVGRRILGCTPQQTLATCVHRCIPPPNNALIYTNSQAQCLYVVQIDILPQPQDYSEFCRKGTSRRECSHKKQHQTFKLLTDIDKYCHIFDVDRKHRILICLSCQYAVIPFQIKTHLQQHHKRISPQQRDQIVSEVEAATELARTHAEVVYLAPTDPPITSLPTCFDGLKCQGKGSQGHNCSYICRTPRGIREHCQKEHG